MQLSSVYSCCGLGELADVRPPQSDAEYKAFSDRFFDLLVERGSYYRIIYLAPHNQFGPNEECQYDYLVNRMLEDGWKMVDEFQRNVMYQTGTIRLMVFDVTPLMPILKEKQNAKWRQQQLDENQRFEIAQQQRIAQSIAREQREPELVAQLDQASAEFRRAQQTYFAALEQYNRGRNVRR